MSVVESWGGPDCRLWSTSSAVVRQEKGKLEWKYGQFKVTSWGSDALAKQTYATACVGDQYGNPHRHGGWVKLNNFSRNYKLRYRYAGTVPCVQNQT